ncbi:helix-turn-helix domain-containing protein [Pseudarthrobacter sp. J75]|uniref:TetR/AcrR family transcriptional regulator n=1 Tax=unclassified Pseudarthrobacter TaxID=2647000 RepID=UPI002E81A16C|nr:MULTISPECIES: helix-turn-helix domain-containing protein [unclassified Pseudarthrobacter]MEE2523670.1 helix-turn-helix domain-containing protein [Pseudarthrobacter sp. J47]MEE2530061.1 helix-turn-helix domain-containing protein [Pseudarthrobacter sp. J75]
MSFIPLPPGASLGPPTERSDAARNRERLMAAARELIGECGAEGLTMDRLAGRAGVGKGTVFRRFGSRAGLMLTLLNESEAEFQDRFMFGPPPLGPGAPAVARLVAFGEERIRYVMEHGDLLLAAEASHHRLDVPPAVLWQRHLEVLLQQEGIREETWLLAGSLAATLDPERLLHTVRAHGVSPERLAASWRQLVTRLVRR